ncbi:Protein of unknown function [Sinosporangium album]|uniref:DUF2510 domain-containing protein n=1 Tax=Sinosporangium album TaxID=504805 RepID=A0A1G8C2T2_9ACTN|nr:DUF2510 domain-containing protein [Sinosporangium album]SDH39787.1 Protein of unknown function [Sinosporangium album]
MTTQTPAGWYPDPYGSPQLRWWDGRQWTDATHAVDSAPGSGRSEPGSGPTATMPIPPGAAPAQGPGALPPPGRMPPPAERQQPPGPWGGPSFTPSAAGHHGHPAPPGHAAQPGYPGPPGGTAQFPFPDFAAYGPPPKRATPVWAWVTGGIGVAVVVGLIVVAAVFIVNRDEGRATPLALPTPAPVEPSLPAPVPTLPQPDPVPTSFPRPVDGRITDPATGLSYAFPGSPWSVPQADAVNEAQSNPGTPVWTSAVHAVSHANYDGEGRNWIGNVYTALVPEVFPYSGPENLQQTAVNLFNLFNREYYRPPHDFRVLKDQELKIDGKSAHVIEFQLDFGKEAEESGWKWRMESGAIVLVDRGAGERPAMLYVSVPDNLKPALVKQVLESLKVS